VQDLERFIEFIQTNKEEKDLELPQLPGEAAKQSGKNIDAVFFQLGPNFCKIMVQKKF